MPSPAQRKQEGAEAEQAFAPQESERVQEHEHRHLTVHTLNAKVPIPYFTPHDLASNTRTVTGWLPDAPPPTDLIYYGGLGALAVAGALEWPVALAVAGATWVIRGRGRQPMAPPERGHEPEALPETGTGS